MSSRGTGTERTALAWQRTALSVAGLSAALARLTFGRIGLVALVGVLVAMPVSLWVMREARSRYRQRRSAVQPGSVRGGRATLALAAAVVVLAIVELLALPAHGRS